MVALFPGTTGTHNLPDSCGQAFGSWIVVLEAWIVNSSTRSFCSCIQTPNSVHFLWEVNQERKREISAEQRCWFGSITVEKPPLRKKPAAFLHVITAPYHVMERTQMCNYHDQRARSCASNPHVAYCQPMARRARSRRLSVAQAPSVKMRSARGRQRRRKTQKHSMILSNSLAFCEAKFLEIAPKNGRFEHKIANICEKIMIKFWTKFWKLVQRSEEILSFSCICL